jgi:hypothetical protein
VVPGIAVSIKTGGSKCERGRGKKGKAGEKTLSFFNFVYVKKTVRMGFSQ